MPPESAVTERRFDDATVRLDEVRALEPGSEEAGVLLKQVTTLDSLGSRPVASLASLKEQLERNGWRSLWPHPGPGRSS